MFSFEYTKNKDSRTGIIKTPHGDIKTPAFIFCATKGAIKGGALFTDCTQIVLSNTYHLMVYPGSNRIKELGGLHKFMNWNGPLLTDSGGFQIFSLGHGSVKDEIKGKQNNTRPSTVVSITEDGVKFKSYINGDVLFLTPEKSVEIQRDLGVDFVVSFDECTPFNVPKNYTEASMHRSHRWEKRSLVEFEKYDDGTQKLYGIVQGGIYEDLRNTSCDFVNSENFFGNAVGGSLGSESSQMEDIVGYTMSKLRKDRPTHLLGIGRVQDIFYGVRLGVDTFDCVLPTRLARHGGALVKGLSKAINLNNAKHAIDNMPLDNSCQCHTCKNYSRGYLHYTIKAKEIIAMHLLTTHNMVFMNRLMSEIRYGIESNSLDLVEKEWLREIQ
jgi:queuine tRNA-ribosyltransferase